MKLIVKFNLILLLVFAVAFLAMGYISRSLLQRNAKEEVLENARIMMEAALAVRAYTNTQIKPLLETQLKYSFLPQSVPAYSANEYFRQLKKAYSEYAYKEATLNPTNPINQAKDWEVNIVNNFRQSPSHSELIGERDTPNGRSLYLARPIRIQDAKCLSCHSTPEAAPRSLTDQYGTENGFGWELHDVVGAHIISVPMRLPSQRAEHVFKVFMACLSAVFVVTFLLLNSMLILLVTRPIERLSKIAEEVSVGNMNAPEFQSSGKDEIARLSESFRRMRKSLSQAIEKLET